MWEMPVVPMNRQIRRRVVDEPSVLSDPGASGAR